MTLPEDAITWASLGTIAGASLAVWVATSVVSYMFGAAAATIQKWIALGLSLLLSFATASTVPNPEPMWPVVAFFNGLVIFLTAVGGNTLVANRPALEALNADQGGPFTRPWF